MCSSVSQAVQWLVVLVWYLRRYNWANHRKSHCKVLCAVLRRGRYKLHRLHKTRCKRLYGAVLQQGKIKALHRVGCKAKEKPHHVGGVEYEILSALAAPDIIICCGHDGKAAADLDNNAITGASLACIVTGGIQSSHHVISLVSHNVSPPYLDALNSAEKNQKKNRTQDRITTCTPQRPHI